MQGTTANSRIRSAGKHTNGDQQCRYNLSKYALYSRHGKSFQHRFFTFLICNKMQQAGARYIIPPKIYSFIEKKANENLKILG